MKRWLHLIDEVGTDQVMRRVYKNNNTGQFRIVLDIDPGTEPWKELADELRSEAVVDAQAFYLSGQESEALEAGKVARIVEEMIAKEA